MPLLHLRFQQTLLRHLFPPTLLLTSLAFGAPDPCLELHSRAQNRFHVLQYVRASQNLNFYYTAKTAERDVKDLRTGIEYRRGQIFPIGYTALSRDRKFRELLSGRVEYWDIVPGRFPHLNLSFMGDMNPSETPYRIYEGTYRVYVHYLDFGQRRSMRSFFGLPDGTMNAEMLSSMRTLQILPREPFDPYSLKFSGQWFNPRKHLTAKKVALSIERSRQFKDDPEILPEPAGLVLTLGNEEIASIYRPFANRKVPLNRDDTYLPLHALISPSLPDELNTRTLFKPWASDRYRWMKEELAPRLAKFIVDSILKRGAHFELHAQNIELVLSSNLNSGASSRSC